jgi:hypothetical protein
VQRREETALQELVESLSRYDFDDTAENIETRGIFEDFARLVQKRECAEARDEGGDGLVASERRLGAVKRVYRRIAKSGVGVIGHGINETGRIAQKIPDGHRSLGRFKLQEDRVPCSRIGLDNRHVLELRQILRHGSVEVELAFNDRYQEALQQLIEAKTKGLTIKPRAVSTPSPVIDLMAALKREPRSDCGQLGIACVSVSQLSAVN